jgi:hypothetical protein
MTAEELRELAYSTDEMDAFAVARAAAYLRACADALDAGPVAWMDPLWIEHGGWPGESFHGAPVDGWVGLYPLAMPARPVSRADELGPVAVRYGWDGHGYQYADNGTGSDWLTRHGDAEALYLHPPTLRQSEPMTEAAVEHFGRRALMGHLPVRELIRAIEAETLRRVKECNE